MARTAPYPDNDKSEWVKLNLILPHRQRGLLHYSYAIFADQPSKDRGDDPFLYVSHLSQIREFDPAGEHQRIQQDDSGRMLHASGEHVAPEDVEDFLLLPSTRRWFENKGQFRPPWMFPTYAGVLEGLDPQWMRERFNLAVQSQIDGYIDQNLRGAFDRRLSGDHRGTTYNLKVGASLDDGHITGSSFFPTNSSAPLGNNGDNLEGFFRFIGVSLSGTIATAILSCYGAGQLGSPLLKVYGVDQDNPVAPTTRTEFLADSLTAGIDWDGAWTNSIYNVSPELKTIFQELVDTFTIKNEAIMVQIKDDGSTPTAFNHARTYDGDTSLTVQLDIEDDTDPYIGGNGATAGLKASGVI